MRERLKSIRVSIKCKLSQKEVYGNMPSRYMIVTLNLEQDYLAHHGIKGQKWGVRRFQNPDGTLTAAGKSRYGESPTGNTSSNGKTGMSDSTKKKLKTAAAVTLAVAGTAAVAYVAAKKLDTIAINSLVADDYKRGREYCALRDKALNDYSHQMKQMRKWDEFQKEHNSPKARELALRSLRDAQNSRNYMETYQRSIDRHFDRAYNRTYSAREKRDALKRIINRK